MDAATSKTGSSKRCCMVNKIQEILCISRPAAYGLIKKKAFRTVFAGGRHLISKNSFDACLDALLFTVFVSRKKAVRFSDGLPFSKEEIRQSRISLNQ